MRPTVSIRRRDSITARDLRAQLDRVGSMEVLVGIPMDRTQRRGAKINNASLMYIQTHGSPARNIPPRAVIEPAIEDPENRSRIERELGEAVAALLDKKPEIARRHLDRAGLAGMNAAKGWFTNNKNGWPPNKPAVIKRKGSSRPLIDTGQLRQAITYVVTNAG